MNDIRYIKATEADIGLLVKIRLEMLREVNGLPNSFVYDKVLVDESRRYFENGDHASILAFDGDEVIGCACLSYIRVMPTFSHPTGKRAHLMNVYTRPGYRRMGVARKMIELLIEDARQRGVTEISLDTTRAGRPLYKALGFEPSVSGMVMEIGL